MTKYVERSHFAPLHSRVERWALIVAHRRAGKTVACINELIGRALHTPKSNARFAYLAPYREQAKRVAWDYLLRYSEGMRVHASIADLTITLHGDKKISIHGADNADNLRGQYFDGIVIDEPGNMKPSEFTEIIRPALSDREGWAVFIGTPNGKNEFWDYNELARKAPKGIYDGWFYLNLKASQSGILPQKELDDAATIMSEDEYAQEYENDFGAAIRGSYYGNELKRSEAEGRIGDFPCLGAELLTHTCWDLGYTDDTAIWFFHVQQNRPRFFDYLEVTQHSIPEIVTLLHEKRDFYGLRYGQYYLPHDARAKSLQTGRSIMEQMLALGVRARISPEMSVQDGVQAVRKMLPIADFDAAGCDKGLEHLRQYQREWDEARQVFRPRPLHDKTSHAADSIRIGALGYQEDYGPAKVYIPEKLRPKPKISDGVQLNKLWDTVKRPVGRWGTRI